MSCKKVTVKIAKAIAKAVSPPVIGFIADLVPILAETDWTNDEKRETAVDLAKAKTKKLGKDIEESAIRAVVEASVVGLKKAQHELAEFGKDPDPSEIVQV